MPKLPSLRRYRELAALTQQELADRAGIARTTLVHLEQQKAGARPTTVRKLAEALKVEPRALLS